MDNDSTGARKTMKIYGVEYVEAPAPKRTNACKLTECQGKPRCRQCLAMDSAYARPQAMTEGELWSWVRSVMSQGADIRLDYDHGTHKTYEHYSARLDAAAAERAQELWARIETPNAN